MVPCVYKTRVRLRSEQDWEIISAPERKLASIDVLVKNITRQALGNESVESIGPMRNIRILWGNRSYSRDEYYNSFLEEILEGQTNSKRKKNKKTTVAWQIRLWLWLCVLLHGCKATHLNACQRIYPFHSMIYVLWLALWVALTILLHHTAWPSMCLLASLQPRKRCNISHLHKVTWRCLD